VNKQYFYTSAFSNLCFILSTVDSKIEQHVCIKFCVKLGKSTIKTAEMLCEGSGEHSLSWTAVFEWHSLLRPVRCQLWTMNALGHQTQAK
jgi:hypothetical protein